jgi:hypothetical protein
VNFLEQLGILIASDSKINEIKIHTISNEKDLLHVERKQQQRAISNSMILIALTYGRKTRSFQDLSYALLDRSLLNTPYEKHLDKLRGLTIIGNWDKNEFYIITCYWDFLIKSRKRY